MEKYCINHSFSEAHWYCKKCNASYCFSCVEKKNFKFSKDEPTVHICPVCKRMVEWTGINYISDNVFISTAKALVYPFSSLSMIVVAVLACMGMLYSGNPYINEVLFVIIWTLSASYAQNVLDHTLRGQNNPPKFNHIINNDVAGHIFSVCRQSLLYLVAAISFFGIMELNNPVAAYALMGVFALIFPMGMMKCITSHQLKSFFDLTDFSTVFKQTWAQYIILSILFMPVIGIFHLFVTLPPRLVTPLICILMIVIYRLLGQMILKCHTELKLSLNYEYFKDKYSLETLHGFKA